MSAGFRGIQDLETNLEWPATQCGETRTKSGKRRIAAEGSLIDSLA
jgi:hypothetical protein